MKPDGMVEGPRPADATGRRDRQKGRIVHRCCAFPPHTTFPPPRAPDIYLVGTGIVGIMHLTREAEAALAASSHRNFLHRHKGLGALIDEAAGGQRPDHHLRPEDR